MVCPYPLEVLSTSAPALFIMTEENINLGFVKIYRSFKNWYGSRCPYRTSLWVHLIMLANHKPARWIFKGEPYSLKRGQFITSRKSLAKLTGMNRSRVDRLLAEFEKDGQIEQQTSNRNRLITITNYDKYQAVEQQVSNRWATDEQQMSTNKNVKNKKKVINKEFVSQITALLDKYPNNDGRKKSQEKLIKTITTKEQLAQFELALNNYLAQDNVKRGEYVKNMSTFVNNWEDFLTVKPKEAASGSRYREFKA